MENKSITINLTDEQCEEIFYNALCNGLGYISGYGLKLCYNKEQYEAAKQSIAKEGVTTCYEDVLMQILRQGGFLRMRDIEGSEEPKTIKMQDVHSGVRKSDPYYVMEFINEEDDADSADAIIQTVFFGEVIFG